MPNKMCYSPKELQKVLGLSKNLVYDLIHTAGFPAIRVGGRYVVPAAALEKWLMEQANHDGFAV